MNQGLNFPAFIKRGAHPIGNIGGNERLLNGWRLGIESHKNGNIIGRDRWRYQQLLNLSDYFLAHLRQILAEKDGRFTGKPFG